MQSPESHRQLIIGTRASPMAVVMAESVAATIRAAAPSISLSIQTFVADGDKVAGSLQSLGGKGTFIKDLERRLLSGEIDCAVHSLKDIPGDLLPHEELALASFMPREDARDALILREGISEEDLKTGGVIGSSAPRRAAALAKLYPKSEVRLCRGNVNSRLRKLDAGEYDAIVLSYAGMQRLGFEGRVARVYGEDEVLPAVGQGIMAVQVRKADLEKCPYLKQISDTRAEIAAKVERAMLFRLQGNCHSAIAGYCSFTDGGIVMRGMVYKAATGDFVVAERAAEISADVEKIGALVAEDLIAQGALGLMAA